MLAMLIGSGSLPAEASGPEHVRFRSPEGVDLEAELYRPDGPGPFPAVVAMHRCGGLYQRGGPNSP